MRGSYFFMLSLLLKLVIVKIVIGSGSYTPPDNVIFAKSSKDNDEMETITNLKLMSDTFVANENLPVWIAYVDTAEKLVRLPQVMNDIGPFHMYQDVDNCGAAIYFSNRQQFDGTVDISYVITNVRYDSETNEVELSRNNIHPPARRSHREQLVRYKPSQMKSKNTGIYEPHQKIEIDRWNFVQSRLPMPEVVYVEVLVIVNYDMAEHFNQDYTSIVSYLLVTFNSVDKLFSPIDEPKIRINIAGIIIGYKRESFPELVEEECYKLFEENIEELDFSCVTNTLQITLNNYKEIITLESYDVVVFLTNFRGHSETSDGFGRKRFIPITGYADKPDLETHQGYQLASKHARIAAVSNYYDEYQFYPDIAHEIAHLLNVYHDEGEFRNTDGECVANLMRTDGSLCKKCLFFGGTTPEQLKRFFSSREGCSFHNKPKSLYDPQLGPQLVWNDDKQCQCYGYDYSYNSHSNFWNNCKEFWGSEIDCKSRLKCVRNENGTISFHFAAYLMDGSPCNKMNKVCWNRKCEKILDPKQFFFIST